MTTKSDEIGETRTASRRQPGKTYQVGSADSREDVLEAFLEEVRVQIEHTDKTTLQIMRGRLVQTGQPESADHSVTALVDALSQGRKFSSEETLLMDLEIQRRAFELRRELLRGALTTTEVAQLLGVKRQTPHDRVRSGTLLGIEENGRWLFPYWQFDAAGPNGVINGLPETLRALRTASFAKANWLTLPNPYLEGRSPLNALKDGDLERVLDIASAVGAN